MRAILIFHLCHGERPRPEIAESPRRGNAETSLTFHTNLIHGVTFCGMVLYPFWRRERIPVVRQIFSVTPLHRRREVILNRRDFVKLSGMAAIELGAAKLLMSQSQPPCPACNRIRPRRRRPKRISPCESRPSPSNSRHPASSARSATTGRLPARFFGCERESRSPWT